MNYFRANFKCHQRIFEVEREDMSCVSLDILISKQRDIFN